MGKPPQASWSVTPPSPLNLPRPLPTYICQLSIQFSVC
jgi:hypothetical protein